MRIIYGLCCLFFLIFFHELGHFIFAKLFGVKVEAFSIGFGPVLLHKKHGDTDYRWSLIPLGGYCAMKGEQDFRNALDAGLSEIQAEPDSMYGVHPLKRALIAFAGPFFNLIFAFLGSVIIAMAGYSYWAYSNKIIIPSVTDYPELHSAARDAGLQSGDRIIRVNGNETNDFSDLILQISTRADEDIELTVLRDSTEHTFIVHSDFDKQTGSGKIGIIADTDTLEKKEARTYSFFPALVQGFKETCKNTGITLKGITILFKGANLQETVSGPARIADMMGSVLKESFKDSFRNGLANMLSFMSVISISLAIMNLLPVPILDGGLILFALIEFLSNRKLSPKVLYYIQFLGLAFIAVFFVIGLSGDIHYFINNFKGIK